MQTLNVGAGRTDQEDTEAEEQRRADLVADSRSDANYFFWAAGLAAIGTGLLPVRLNILVSVGLFDLLRFYGRPLFPFCSRDVWGGGGLGGYPVSAGIRRAQRPSLGVPGRHGSYGADMIALMATFSLWAFGVHAFFVLKWFQGQKALKDLNDPASRAFEFLRSGPMDGDADGRKSSLCLFPLDWPKTTTLAQGGHRFRMQRLISLECCYLPFGKQMSYRTSCGFRFGMAVACTLTDRSFLVSGLSTLWAAR